MIQYRFFCWGGGGESQYTSISSAQEHKVQAKLIQASLVQLFSIN